MRSITTRLMGAGVVALLGLSLTACDDFVDVRNPMELEADQVDPEADAGMFAGSAWQNLGQSYGNLILYDAWFTAAAWVGDTFPTRNEFGIRTVLPGNGTHNSANWAPLQMAISTGEAVIRTLEESPGPNLARGYLTSGFGTLLQAEKFCEGTVAVSATEPGPRMSTSQLLDHAIDRLSQARSVAQGAGADDLAHAASVGLARAHLFAGNMSAAMSEASGVPDDFEFSFTHIDDPGNRGRLGNNIYAFTVNRLSLVVPPYYREMADEGDPRIGYDDAGHEAQDGELHFWRQQKYTGWADPIRLASGLEARYIEAEASGDVGQQLALINERRAVGNQDEFTSNDPDEVLAELMHQRSRDFWLEGKRMGDHRRNPGYVPFVIEPGEIFYKPDHGAVGSQDCWPVTNNETNNNPNWN